MLVPVRYDVALLVLSGGGVAVACFFLSVVCAILGSLLLILYRPLKASLVALLFLGCALSLYNSMIFFDPAQALLSENDQLMVAGNTSAIFAVMSGTPIPLLYGLRSVSTHELSGAGRYNPVTRAIYLNPEDVTAETWQHEVGHHVLSYMVTEHEVIRWEEIHEEYFDAAPTSYARTSMDEDFAESFALYSLMPCRLEQARRRFLDGVFGRLLSNYVSPVCLE